MKVGDEFTCEKCGETFTTGWGDDEARDEYEANFPEAGPHAAEAVICDACYQKLMVWVAVRRNG